MPIKKKTVSPRQKMINLMYVVLMAMLALNVSSDVLGGYSVIERSLNRTAEYATEENRTLYATFEQQYKSNTVKNKEWYRMALTVKKESQNLYDQITEIKQLIAEEADGKGADINNIKNKESLDAAAQVMLAPGQEWGNKLYDTINNYRKMAMQMVEDPRKQTIIEENLSTEVPANNDHKNWKEYFFENMPAIAVMSYLTKLQSDIRYTEGMVLHTLMESVDDQDLRVNALEALVIPNTKTVVAGGRFTADIVMAAVDTTQVPRIYVNNTEINGNTCDIPCPKKGDFLLTGHLETTDRHGKLIRREFAQPYSVVEPTATVSADMMNVLYAGYYNPVSISVPGVPLNKIQASVSSGLITQKAPGKYIVKPIKAGQNVVITVTSNQEGRQQQMAQYSFRVKKLPEPAPYMDVRDAEGLTRYKGGKLNRSMLVTASGIGAAIDDDILHVPFKVLDFETVFFDGMGNAVPIASDGERFSERQREMFRKMTRGKRFYVSRVRAIGPDGIMRHLNTSMEVIIK